MLRIPAGTLPATAVEWISAYQESLWTGAHPSPSRLARGLTDVLITSSCFPGPRPGRRMDRGIPSAHPHHPQDGTRFPCFSADVVQGDELLHPGRRPLWIARH